jgi:hypothetical protein
MAAPEDAELADVLDRIGNPAAVMLSRIQAAAYGDGDFGEWIKDRKNRRAIPHRMEKCGYIAVHNMAAQDGLWKAGGRRQVIYARSALPLVDQIKTPRMCEPARRPREPNACGSTASAVGRGRGGSGSR